MNKLIRTKNCDNGMVRIPIIPGYVESHARMSSYRAIFLSEEISKTTASELSALLLYHDNQDHEFPIQIYINSPGGEASSMVQILDVMSMIEAPVHTIIMGKAYSAAAVLDAAGDLRFALQSSKMMIHGVQFGFPIPGQDISDNKNYYAFVHRHNDVIQKMLAKYTGKALAQVKEDLSRELWLTATEAVKYGLIDYVI